MKLNISHQMIILKYKKKKTKGGFCPVRPLDGDKE